MNGCIRINDEDFYSEEDWLDITINPGDVVECVTHPSFTTIYIEGFIDNSWVEVCRPLYKCKIFIINIEDANALKNPPEDPANDPTDWLNEIEVDIEDEKFNDFTDEMIAGMETIGVRNLEIRDANPTKLPRNLTKLTVREGKFDLALVDNTRQPHLRKLNCNTRLLYSSPRNECINFTHLEFLDFSSCEMDPEIQIIVPKKFSANKTDFTCIAGDLEYASCTTNVFKQLCEKDVHINVLLLNVVSLPLIFRNSDWIKSHVEKMIIRDHHKLFCLMGTRYHKTQRLKQPGQSLVLELNVSRTFTDINNLLQKFDVDHLILKPRYRTNSEPLNTFENIKVRTLTIVVKNCEQFLTGLLKNGNVEYINLTNKLNLEQQQKIVDSIHCDTGNNRFDIRKIGGNVFQDLQIPFITEIIDQALIPDLVNLVVEYI